MRLVQSLSQRHARNSENVWRHGIVEAEGGQLANARLTPVKPERAGGVGG